MARALTMLNELGDTTLAWDESADAEMLEVIRRKMAEGITFFLIEPRLEGLASPTKTPLSEPEEALKHRAVSIRDEDLARFVSTGKVRAIRTPRKPAVMVKIADTAEEAVRGETVATRRHSGG